MSMASTTTPRRRINPLNAIEDSAIKFAFNEAVTNLRTALAGLGSYVNRHVAIDDEALRLYHKVADAERHFFNVYCMLPTAVQTRFARLAKRSRHRHVLHYVINEHHIPA